MVDAADRVLKSGRNGYWSGEGEAVGELPSGVYYLYLSTSKKNQILRFVKQ